MNSGWVRNDLSAGYPHLIWYVNEPQKLSKLIASIIRDSSNVLMLSMASIWEIQIKVQLGKLKLSRPLQEVIQQQQQQNRLHLLPITLPHVLAVGSLPMHHRDPFDRMLIAQAQVENMTLISHDPVMSQYPITVIWQ